MGTRKSYEDTLPLRYANTNYRGVTMESLMAHHNSGTKKRIVLVDCPPDLPARAVDIPKSAYPLIPQDHPAWMDLRGMPRITASQMSDALLFWQPTTVGDLGLDKRLADTSAYSGYWHRLAVKKKFGWVPDAPLDTTGHCFATWGNRHEAAALHSVMMAEPTATYYDQGLTIFTKETWEKLQLVDFLADRKVFTDFPIEIGASPDGIFEIPDAETGEIERFGCEWKTPTFFLPENRTTYYWSKFYPSKYYKPYPKPKAYYIPQMMAQAGALGVKRIYHGSWAYEVGMRNWLIDYSHEYLSMMMTLINHVIQTFLDPALEKVAGTNEVPQPKVPMNYFHMRAPGNVRRLHSRLVSMTRKICETVPEHSFISGDDTRRWTDMPGIADAGGKFVEFPDIPREMPAHMPLYIFASKTPTIVPATLSAKLTWPNSLRELKTRRTNLASLVDCVHPLPQFSQVIEALGHPIDIPAPTQSEWFCEHAIVTRQELFVGKVIRVLHTCEETGHAGRALSRLAAAGAHKMIEALPGSLFANSEGTLAAISKIKKVPTNSAMWIRAVVVLLDTLLEIYSWTHNTRAHPRGHLADMDILVRTIEGALDGKPETHYSPLLAVIVACDVLHGPFQSAPPRSQELDEMEE